MNLLLPRDIRARLKAELRRAGEREVGGFLMAEQIEPGTFRVAEISVDHGAGTAVHFRRRIEEHREELQRFFAKTGHDFSRYNYLGEWHSHPRFALHPSADDVSVMEDLVRDPTIGFAVLMIVRLDWYCWLRVSAHVFSDDRGYMLAKVE
jgi:hypothetical protein